jgi:hypothetical protein
MSACAACAASKQKIIITIPLAFVECQKKILKKEKSWNVSIVGVRDVHLVINERGKKKNRF